MVFLDAILAFAITILLLSLVVMLLVDQVVRVLELRPWHLRAALRVLYLDFCTFRRIRPRVGTEATRLPEEADRFVDIVLRYAGLREKEATAERQARDARDEASQRNGIHFVEFTPVDWVTEELLATILAKEDLFTDKGLSIFGVTDGASGPARYWPEFVAYAREQFPVRARNEGDLFTWKAKRLGYSFAFALAFAVNVNAIDVFQTLMRDGAARRAVIAAYDSGAVNRVATASAGDSAAHGALRLIADAGLPIGWTRSSVTPALVRLHADHPPYEKVASALLVWLLGASVAGLLIGQGAPFWFDAVKVLVRVRGVSGVASQRGPPAKREGEGKGERERQGEGGGGVVVVRPVVPPPPPIQRPHTVLDPRAYGELLRRAARAFWEQYRTTANVLGVGVGTKLVGAERVPCLVVHLERRVDDADEVAALQASGALLPKTFTFAPADGPPVEIAVDVQEVGEVRAASCGPGGDICNARTRDNTGSAGLVAWDGVARMPVLLTCYHVVAVSGVHRWDWLEPTGTAETIDVVLPKVEAIGRAVFGIRDDELDVALIAPIDAHGFDAKGAMGAPVARARPIEVSDVDMETRVLVIGAKSGSASGRIVNRGVSVTINYVEPGGIRRWTLHDLVAVSSRAPGAWRRITRGGDSGALLVGENGDALGIVVADSPAVTYAIPIQKVLQRLELSAVLPPT